MQQTIEANADSRVDIHLAVVTIHVNERPVHLRGHRHTGLEIKEAAVEQHVKIELDFLLYLEGPEGQAKHIDDGEEVTVTDKTHFAAVPDDDNS
jgi:multiubiquitin